MPNATRYGQDEAPRPNGDGWAVALRSAPWILILAAWSVPALVDVADTFITDRLTGQPIALWRAFVLAAPGWYYWAALTPVIVWLGRRLPIRRPLQPRVVLAQLGLSVAGGLAHALVLTLRSLLFDPRAAGSIRGAFFMALSDWLPISIVIWWAVLGAGHAVDNFRRYREQQLRASELEARLARSELAVLRAQLNPHFLFNALNTGVSLVRAGDADRGAQVLTRLGDLLRRMLRADSAQECTLGEELAVLRDYCEIELVRFGDRLTIDVDVPDAALDILVPSLALQPLVENAVRHGIAPRDAPGRVRVRARQTNGVLLLSVADDGRGLPAGWSLDASDGVGLSNTRDRLARLYGRAGALEVSSLTQGGVEVTMRVPVNRGRHTTHPSP
jgi:signal transduction histidine kinase